LLPRFSGNRGLGNTSDLCRVKQIKDFVREYKGRPVTILFAGEPGVGKTTLCNHIRSIMNAMGPYDNYVTYGPTAPGGHYSSVTSTLETYMLGGNKYLCLQDGKGLEHRNLRLLLLLVEGRIKNGFNMTIDYDEIKDIQAKKCMGQELTREEEQILSLLRVGTTAELERYRPKAVFLVMDATATSPTGLEHYRKMARVVRYHDVKVIVILNKCDEIIEDNDRQHIYSDPLLILESAKVDKTVEKVSAALGVEEHDVYPMISRPMKKKELTPEHSLLVIRPFTFILNDLIRCHRERIFDDELEWSEEEVIDVESDEEEVTDGTQTHIGNIRGSDV